jgi:hypothetical protein
VVEGLSYQLISMVQLTFNTSNRLCSPTSGDARQVNGAINYQLMDKWMAVSKCNTRGQTLVHTVAVVDLWQSKPGSQTTGQECSVDYP